MNEQTASARLATGSDRIYAVLTDPLALPQWNEAFLSISGPPQPVAGVRYRLAVRPGLPGHWEYTTIQPDLIEAEWSVPGFRERGTWTLRPHEGGGTLVTHAFQHTGPLAAVLSRLPGRRRAAATAARTTPWGARRRMTSRRQ